MSTEQKQAEICRECGRSVRIFVPAGADGSVDLYATHKTKAGIRCAGSRQETTETKKRRRF